MEQRIEDRFDLEAEAMMATPDHGPQKVSVVDISFHGLRVRYPFELPMGTPIKLRVDFLYPESAGKGPVLQGVVRHHFAEPGGGMFQIGVQLRFQSPEDEAAFQSSLQTALDRRD